MIKKLVTFSAASLLSFSLVVPGAQASEDEHFREAVDQAIGPIVREEVDVAIEATEHLVKQAAQIVGEAAAEFQGPERVLLETAAASAPAMLDQSPEALEDGWHNGEALSDKGISLDDFDHFSPVMAYYDMVIHPATAHSLLKAYQQSKDHNLLEQAREELAELLEHEEMEETEGHGEHGEHAEH